MGIGKAIFGSKRRAGVESLGARETFDHLQRDEVILVDVRDEHDWASGGIAGSYAISYSDPEFKYKMREIVQDDLTRNVALICKTGPRAGQAAIQLVREGFKHIGVVRGGIAAWRGHGLPVVTGRS